MSKTASESFLDLSYKSFLDFSGWNAQRIHRLFGLASEFRERHQAELKSPTVKSSRSLVFAGSGKTASLLFFEPSTRTRMSFESACHRIGLSAMVLDTGGGTSLEKGETVEDSILNLAAMEPVVMIVRCNNDTDLAKLQKRISCPIVNAGWGVIGHPTQALLDAFTFREHFPEMDQLKLLMVGDIKHSRVASSHFALAKILGYKIAICGPKQLMVQEPGVEIFENLDQAMKWSNTVMMLRFQFERHGISGADSLAISPKEARAVYGMTTERAKQLDAKTWITHPGPVIHGVEMDSEVLQDPRCLVLNQVTNGVYTRQALLLELLSRPLLTGAT